MIDYIRIVNDAKCQLIAELEILESNQHLDKADEERRAAVDAQIVILNKVHAEMLRQENVALDQAYLRHRARSCEGRTALQRRGK